jgi:hypothetical protein
MTTQKIGFLKKILPRKIVLASLGLLAAAVIVAIVAGYLTLARIANNGGLNAILEDTLSDQAAGISSSVESTALAFRFSTTPLRLKAKNIRLMTSDASLHLQSSEFGFSLYNILTGRLVPSDMWMSGLEIEITHGPEGWHAGPSMALITMLLQHNPKQDADPQVLSFIDNIYIGNAKVRIHRDPTQIKDDLPKSIVLAPISISMRYQKGQINGHIAINNSLGGAVRIDFLHDESDDESDDEIKFSASLDGINIGNIYPYLGLNIPEISTVGQVDGNLTLSVKDRQIVALSGDLTTGLGEATLTAVGRIRFSSASVLFDYNAAEDVLAISNFDMATVNPENLSLGKINISGRVREPFGQKPLVIAKLRGSDLPFERVMQIWPEENRKQLYASMGGHLSGGEVLSLGVDVVGVLERSRNLFEIKTLDLLSELRSINFSAGFLSVRRLTGMLRARLELSIGASGRIDHASADLLLRDAELTTASSDRIIDLEGVEIRASLDGNIIDVSRGAIDARKLGQMAMAAKIELEPDWNPRRVDLSVRAEQIDKNLFVDLWPQDIQPRTRRLVDTRIHGGQLNGLFMNAGFKVSHDAPTEVLYLDGKARLVDTALTYLETMPPVTGLDAPLSFEKLFLRADFETATLNGIDLAGSRVIIRKNPDGAGAAADVTMLAKGEANGAVKLINHPRLDLLKNTGITMIDTTGGLDATLSLKWVIPPDGRAARNFSDIDINLAASITDMTAGDLLEGIDFADGNLDVLMAEQQLNISGRGKFNNVPTVLSLIYNANKKLDMMVKADHGKILTKMIGETFNLNLTGKTRGVVHALRRHPADPVSIEIDVDLTETGIDLERLGLTKPPMESARMTAQLELIDGRLARTGNIDLASESINFGGHILFDENHHFLGAYLDRVVWPGHDITRITVEHDDDNVLHVFADADVIDLTLFRGGDHPSTGSSLAVDLTAKRLILDDNLMLSGNLGVTATEDSKGAAKFFGTLFFNDEAFIQESALTAQFGHGETLVEGRGLIGTAESSISFSSSDTGDDSLVLRSDNGGQVLKALGVTDSIRGGKLNMMVDFLPGTEERLMVNLHLENFRVIEAPTSIRMLSVLSLAGMYSLIEGDGTHFDQGHAQVEIFGDKVIIRQARSTGTALAVDFVGVYNKKTLDLEVSGALLPIYGITKILGNIPLVGEILTGLDNSGLLVTQFTINGKSDAPETNINLSSVIPGLFRDVFSPNWVNRERKRLTGSDNATGAGG